MTAYEKKNCCFSCMLKTSFPFNAWFQTGKRAQITEVFLCLFVSQRKCASFLNMQLKCKRMEPMWLQSC